jgi:hypothetical protein
VLVITTNYPMDGQKPMDAFDEYFRRFFKRKTFEL